jgi:hypothetical protein
MARINGRRVHVSFTGNATNITLAWFTPKDEGGEGFTMRELHYPNGSLTDSVEKALDILVPDWSKVCVSTNRKSVVSHELDSDPDLFDAIAEAEEPEQYFISRYVLEYCEGKPAHVRQWEKNFNKSFAKLIAFNAKQSAKA